MKNIEYIKDNEEKRNDEYVDSEIIADNEDEYNYARIAHEVHEDVEYSFSEIPENPDVGSTDFKDRCFNTLTEDYNYLSADEMHKVVEIIMENYE